MNQPSTAFSDIDASAITKAAAVYTTATVAGPIRRLTGWVVAEKGNDGNLQNDKCSYHMRPSGSGPSRRRRCDSSSSSERNAEYLRFKFTGSTAVWLRRRLDVIRHVS